MHVHDAPARGTPSPAAARVRPPLVVPVDRTDVLQPEVLEHALRRDHVLDALLDAVQRVEQAPPTTGVRCSDRLPQSRNRSYPRVVRSVARWFARPPMVGAYERSLSLTTMTSGRSLSTAMLLSASHAMPPVSAPSPITATVCRSRLAAHSARLGDAVGPREGGRRVRVLDDVVLGLGAAAGSRTGRPSSAAAEVVPAGEQLVHVGLVTGVQDHRVAWRVEDPVQRDRELDHAEVGAEVAAGPRDVSTRKSRISCASSWSREGSSALTSLGPSMRVSRVT